MRLILCYHALADEGTSEPGPNGVLTGLSNAVRAHQLRAQIAWLRKKAEVVSLDELVAGNSVGSRKLKVAITFDDGYRSVIRHGLTEFRRHGMPVTWFIPTSFTQSAHKLPWWDMVTRVLAVVSGTVSLGIRGETRDYQLSDRCDRMRFQQAVRSVFLGSDEVIKADLLQQLLEIGRGGAAEIHNDIARAEELQEALAGGYLELGGHSTTHLNMGDSPPERMRVDVAENREFVTQLSGQAPKWFAYPYGGEEHISLAGVEAVKCAGYSGAVTTVARHLGNSEDPYLIPRITVQPGWNLKKFVLSVKAPVMTRYATRVLGAIRYRPC